MTTGRKPLPTPLKILRTTTKKGARIKRRAIETPGDIGEAPPWLTKDQRDDWDYAIQNAPRDVLRRIDKAVLAAFVVAQDTHRRSSMAMQTTQLLIKSPKQELPMQNPYLPIINRQAVLMARIAAELGFTPCSRARLEIGAGARGETVGGWDEIENAG